MDNEEIQTNAQNNNKDSKENPDTINRLCRFAFIMSTISVFALLSELWALLSAQFLKAKIFLFPI